MTLEIRVGPPQLTVHQGYTVMVSDSDGQIPDLGQNGLFFLDTRLICYPLAMRGRAMSVGTLVNWAANLMVALSFLTLTTLWQIGYFLAVWGHLLWSLVLRLLPRAGDQGKDARTDRSAVATR